MSKATARLRKLIERKQVRYLWGRRKYVTPRLVERVFGDGKKLIEIGPIMFRPNCFVVRVDSGWSTDNWSRHPHNPQEWLDEVLDAIEEEYPYWPWAKRYGLRERDDGEGSARTDFSDGCEWGEIEWPGVRK